MEGGGQQSSILRMENMEASRNTSSGENPLEKRKDKRKVRKKSNQP